MANELTVNPSKYGIEEKQALELIGDLPQIIQERNELSKQFEETSKLDRDLPETSKKARELRLKIKDNRTKGIEVWHKSTKEFFLKGGKFIDDIKKEASEVNTKMEQELSLIENHFAIKEAERKEKLKAERTLELEPYNAFLPIGLNLGEMEDEDYQKLLNGAILQYNQFIEEERLAEIERQKQIELQQTFEKRQKEIAPYYFFSETTISIGMEEEDYQFILNNAIKAKQEDDKQKEIQRLENERLEKEAEILRAKAAAERLKQDEILKKEREAKAKLEAELKAKKEQEARVEAERKAEQERLAKEAKELANAPIKDRMSVWVNSFKLPDIDLENNTTKEIQEKFKAFKTWSLNEIQKF